MMLTSPSGCAATHGKNWSVLVPSSFTFAGRDQLVPPFFDADIRTSEFVHGGRPVPSGLQEPSGKSVHATKIVPSGAIVAVGKLFDRNPTPGEVPKFGSALFRRNRPGLRRPETTSPGAVQSAPPSFDPRIQIRGAP